MNSKSKSKNATSIRVFGQRSIASTFRSVTPNATSSDSEGSVKRQASRKSETSPLSLSHLLNRGCQKPPHLPQIVPGKSTPFQSPIGLRRVLGGEERGNDKQVEKGENGASGSDDKVIFEGFKQTEEDKGEFVSELGVDEIENSVGGDFQESKKRKNPFEGGKENQTARKHVVVLGGESNLKPKGQIKNVSSNQEPRPLYNHYANGRGWWDYDMEGVDNEELGFNEVWEGVGSTTLGGIVDWH